MLISGSPRGISALYWFLRKFHRVMEAQLNLNIDLLQKSMEELMVSFIVDSDQYLKLDMFLPPMDWWCGRKVMDSKI